MREKDKALIDGTEAVIRTLEELQRQVMDELLKATLGSWDVYHLKNVLNSIEGQIRSFRDAAKSEMKAGLDTSWEMGKNLVDVPLANAGIYTGFHISTSVLDVMREFAFHKIDDVSDAAWVKIRGELTLGVMGGKTPQQVAEAIGKNLKDPGIFSSIGKRAEVITQTEMGRVFSTAAEKRMEEAGKYVDGLEKQWLHAGHPKVPRETHLAAHGQHVPVNEPFDIGGVMMMQPRDADAPIEEVINCGCDHVPFHKNWQ